MKINKNNITTCHDILSEWNYNKNDINPLSVGLSSLINRWWICEKKHEWEDSPVIRSKGNKCPYCANKKIGYGNDLESQNPLLLTQWNYHKNDIKPSEVYAKSNKEVWWTCEKKHDFKASISSRCNMKVLTCPTCKNGESHTVKNNLAEIHPKLLLEWDYKKNKMKPDEISAKSLKKVWFTCLEHDTHSYSRTITSKLSFIGKCPTCREKTISSFCFAPRKVA
jgi:hypothetical protein